MARQTSNPGLMIAGGVVFLVMPFLWSKATGDALSTRSVIVGLLLAALFFYLAAKYHRERRSAGSGSTVD
jgi:hypothetical protein